MRPSLAAVLSGLALACAPSPSDDTPRDDTDEVVDTEQVTETDPPTDQTDPPVDPTDPPAVDADGDGVPAALDCDDDDASVGAPVAWFLDADGDGFGDEGVATEACEAPADHVALPGDCDDGDALVHPGAEERCATPYDDDCDGSTNEDDAVDAEQWFADADGDGFGSGTPFTACLPPGEDWATQDGDCDDDDDARNPAALELCSTPFDDDCDADNDDAGIDAPTWWRDEDRDGWGATTGSVTLCTAPDDSWVIQTGDCDDEDANRHPFAVERCATPYDDDCDGDVNDPDAIDAQPVYVDADGDGFGVGAAAMACTGATVDGDCDDDDALVFPGAPELCDGQPNDCDAADWTPEAEDGLVAYELDGVWTDVTAQFTGTFEAPLAGTLYVCPGTYEVRVEAMVSPGTPAAVRVVGTGGADVTILDAHGEGPVFDIQSVAVTLEGLTLTGGRNDAERGGGIRHVGAGAVEVLDCVITGNTAWVGGGIYSDGILVLDGTEIVGNTATGLGGGLYHEGPSIQTRGGRIAGNVATYGGGVCHDGYVASWNARFTDTVVEHNTARDGGGFNFYRAGARLENVIVRDNTATGNGGGLYYENSSLIADGVRVVGNTATDGGGIFADDTSIGGESSDFTLAVVGNQATRNGGGIYVFSSLNPFTSLTRARVEDNTAGERGGGVYLVGSTFTAAEVTIAGNAAEHEGGGIYQASGASVLTRTSIRENVVTGTDAGRTYAGAGMATAQGPVRLREGTLVAANGFACDTCTTFGGGLHIEGSPKEIRLEGVIVHDNTAKFGGGVHLSGGSSLILQDGAQIRDNTALSTGGGVYVTAGRIDCTGSSDGITGFLGNVAEVDGGGVAILPTASPGHIQASLCDFGETGTADDNVTPYDDASDVLLGVTLLDFGDDATFTCDVDGGC